MEKLFIINLKMQSKQTVRLLSFREIPYVNKKTGLNEVFSLVKVLEVVNDGNGDTFEFNVSKELIQDFKTLKQLDLIEIILQKNSYDGKDTVVDVRLPNNL